VPTRFGGACDSVGTLRFAHPTHVIPIDRNLHYVIIMLMIVKIT
jgi:hypothetical protein